MESIFFQSVRDGVTVYSKHQGMDVETVIRLMGELGHSAIVPMAEDDYKTQKAAQNEQEMAQQKVQIDARAAALVIATDKTKPVQDRLDAAIGLLCGQPESVQSAPIVSADFP